MRRELGLWVLFPSVGVCKGSDQVGWLTLTCLFIHKQTHTCACIQRSRLAAAQAEGRELRGRVAAQAAEHEEKVTELLETLQAVSGWVWGGREGGPRCVCVCVCVCVLSSYVVSTCVCLIRLTPHAHCGGFDSKGGARL